MKIRIGSRESRLAVIQSEMVQRWLTEHVPEAEVSIVTMKTTGDIILDRPLAQVGGKGLFVKELDRALLDGRTDLSVHSLKDLPMEVSGELPVVAYSQREDERDVLILPEGAKEIDFSKPIGTSSLRRVLQLKRLYPQAVFESVRGNVVTRLRKLDEGQYSALILAGAGVKRMGLEHRISRYFSVDEVIPAAGQGILAVQGRQGQDYSYLDGYGDQNARLAALAERAFVRALDGGCSSPVAAHAVIEDQRLTLTGLYYAGDGDQYETAVLSGNAAEAETIGQKLAEQFLEKKAAKGRPAGKVWLVGAGPGDAGLLTLKGARALEQAQVVVYDSLVGDGVLALIPPHVKTINVGKRAGNHTMPQEQINQVLLEEAQAGQRVVRLKGGDPFLFGRGGEELELLAANGIPYEIVPGITSAIAVPAYNGIPVTHRDFCSSVHIITGHQKKGEPLKIDFEALVRTRGTLVFLMGISALPAIMQGLLAAGMRPDMPCAVLSRGTTAFQKCLDGTVGEMERIVKEQGVVTPAIIVVGDVCALHREFSWYEKLPLAGCRVVVTRPRDRSGRMSRLLREKGAEVLELPSIETAPAGDLTRLREAFERIGSYQWIAFTSPYGVRVFFDELLNSGRDVRALAGQKFAAIGEGTKKALAGYGIRADLVPEVYDGWHLGLALADNCDFWDKILLPRAAAGSKELLEALARRQDLTVDDLPVYETGYTGSEVLDAAKLFEDGAVTLAVFTSASTVRGFLAAAPSMDPGRVTAVCIGRQTAAEAEAAGMKTAIAEKATLDSLADCVEQVYHKKSATGASERGQDEDRKI